MDKSYGSIKFGKLKKAISQIEKLYDDKSPQEMNDVDITFEYLIGSFFPDVVKNVREEANKQYMKGYLAGLKENKNEN